MALEKQIISVPFIGGVDTKNDPKFIEPGSLSDVINGIYTKGKTINKRNGYDALSTTIITGASIVQGNKLATRDDELALLNDQALYTYSTQSTAWINKGASSSISVSSNLFSQTDADGTSNLFPDVALNGSIKVIAWSKGAAGVYATVIDQNTNTQYQSSVLLATPISTGFNVRVCSIGAFIFVFYLDNNNIVYRRLNIATPQTFGVQTTLIGGGTTLDSTSSSFDAISYGASNGLVTVYNVPGVEFVVYKIDSAGAILLTQSIPAPAAPYAIDTCVDSSNNNIYVTVIISPSPTTSLRYFVLNSALVTLLGLTTIDTGTATQVIYNASAIIESANQMRVFWSYFNIYPSAALDDFSLNDALCDNIGTINQFIGIVRQLNLVSRPFIYQSETYVLCRNSSFLQSTYWLINSLGKIVAKSNTDFAFTSNQIAEKISSVITTASGIFDIVKEVTIASEIVNGTRIRTSNISEMTFDFVSKKGQQSKEINRYLIISGGYPQIYDGSGIFEYGFNTFPENIVATITAAGGALTIGTYTYYVTYEWNDAQGNKYRSAPSTGTVVTIGVNNSLVTLNIPTLRLTNKSNVFIFVYRTLVNTSTAHQLLSATGTGGTPNDTTVDYITFIDVQSDTNLSASPILYTTGGIVENINPPAFNNIEIFKNRAILADLEDSKSFWFSKQILPGEGVEFNDTFYVTIDELGASITATKTLDDKLIIFKNNLIFAMTGDGPLDTGEQDNFTVPQLISTDVGCPYPDSIVLMPSGLMFKSYKGIYHLSRSLQVTYVGAPVEAYNTQNITAATLLQSVNQVRFLTSSGRTLLYDHYFDKWNTFLNHTGNDSVIWNGIYVYLRTNAVVYKEDTTSFTDAGTAIVLHPTSPWIKLNSYEGYQRVRRAALLGNYFSAHTLTIKVYYDYNDAVFDTYSFNTATGLVGPDNVYQFRMHLKKQKCEAIKFEFDDSVTVTPGQGYSINDLAVEIGLKRGLDKLPAIKSVG